MAKDSPVSLTPGDGAIVGILSGIAAAVVDSYRHPRFSTGEPGVARRFAEQMSEFPNVSSGVGCRSPGLDAGLSLAMFLLGLFLQAAVFAVLGALGRSDRRLALRKKRRPPLQAGPPPRRVTDMKRLKTQVIVNPESNRGRTRAAGKRSRKRSPATSRSSGTNSPRNRSRPSEISRDAIRRGHELIIGVGGDGTMNEIANGFYDDRRSSIPTRPGNRPFGHGLRPDQEPEHPAGAQRRPQGHHRGPLDEIDVGRVNFTGSVRRNRWTASS